MKNNTVSIFFLIFFPLNKVGDLEKACDSDSNTNIFRCNFKGYKFYSNFKSSAKIVSSVTIRIHDCLLDILYKQLDLFNNIS